MAQGNLGKLGKAKGVKKSAGSQRRKAVNAVKSTKKGGTKMEHNKGIIAATKAINKKNERIIAAKACVGGTHFFLKDIVEKGKNESKRQKATRDKRQNKPKMTDRLKDQIKKLV